MSSNKHQQKKRRTVNIGGDGDVQERQAVPLEEALMMTNNPHGDVNSTRRHKPANQNQRSQKKRPANSLAISSMGDNVPGTSSHHYNLRSLCERKDVGSCIDVKENPLPRQSNLAGLFEEMRGHPMFVQAGTSQNEQRQTLTASLATDNSMFPNVVHENLQRQNVGQSVSAARRSETFLPSTSVNTNFVDENQRQEILGQNDKDVTRNNGNPSPCTSGVVVITRIGSNGELENIPAEELTVAPTKEKTFNHETMSLEDFFTNFCSLRVSTESQRDENTDK